MRQWIEGLNSANKSQTKSSKKFYATTENLQHKIMCKLKQNTSQKEFKSEISEGENSQRHTIILVFYCKSVLGLLWLQFFKYWLNLILRLIRLNPNLKAKSAQVNRFSGNNYEGKTKPSIRLNTISTCAPFGKISTRQIINSSFCHLNIANWS